MKLTRTTRNAGWLVVAGLLGAALIAPAGAAAAPLPGAIWTSLSNGQTVNQNRYDNKADVYLNGGPQNCGNNGLEDGDYYFQVTDPSGKTLLSTDAIKFRQIKVVSGVISGTSGLGNHAVGAGGCDDAKPVQLIPYDDTPNNGDEYSVDMAPAAEVEACDGFNADSTSLNFLKDCKVSSKNDNFKVGETTTTTTTTRHGRRDHDHGRRDHDRRDHDRRDDGHRDHLDDDVADGHDLRRDGRAHTAQHGHRGLLVHLEHDRQRLEPAPGRHGRHARGSPSADPRGGHAQALGDRARRAPGPPGPPPTIGSPKPAGGAREPACAPPAPHCGPGPGPGPGPPWVMGPSVTAVNTNAGPECGWVPS